MPAIGRRSPFLRVDLCFNDLDSCPLSKNKYKKPVKNTVVLFICLYLYVEMILHESNKKTRPLEKSGFKKKIYEKKQTSWKGSFALNKEFYVFTIINYPNRV